MNKSIRGSNDVLNKRMLLKLHIFSQLFEILALTNIFDQLKDGSFLEARVHQLSTVMLSNCYPIQRKR